MFTPWKKSVVYYVACIMGFLGIILTTSYLLPTVHAQTPAPTAASTIPYTQHTPLSEANPVPYNVSPTSPIYTDLIVHNMFHTFSCLAVGQSMIGQPCLTYQPQKDAQGVIRTVPMFSQVDTTGGVLGATTSIIANLYASPPVRTADYVASVGRGFGIIKDANAQVVGSGQAALSPILALWQVSRNIAYLIMTLIFVVIGLMVMFRNKINPQTVISAQAALPGLVLGLILITFSYFFAAFISDTAFIGTNAVGYFFAAAQNKTDDAERLNLLDKVSKESVLSLFSPFLGIMSREKITDIISIVLGELDAGSQTMLRSLAGLIAAQFMYPIAGAIPPPYGLVAGPAVALLTGIATAAAPAQILGFFLTFIAFIALIYQMLQLLFRLLMSYLTIIFLTISAPFHFLAASLPGRQSIGNAWFMNLLANILVFPAVLAVFYFVAFLLGDKNYGPFKVTGAPPVQESAIVSTAYAAGPTIIGSSTFPLFGGMDLDFVKILVAFGALMALPKVPELVVKSIGHIGQAGQVFGQEISGGIRAGRGYASQGQSGIGTLASRGKSDVFGDITWHRTETGWAPYTGKPGLKQWYGQKATQGTGHPGGGRGGLE